MFGHFVGQAVAQLSHDDEGLMWGTMGNCLEACLGEPSNGKWALKMCSGKHSKGRWKTLCGKLARTNILGGRRSNLLDQASKLFLELAFAVRTSFLAIYTSMTLEILKFYAFDSLSL